MGTLLTTYEKEDLAMTITTIATIVGFVNILDKGTNMEIIIFTYALTCGIWIGVLLFTTKRFRKR